MTHSLFADMSLPPAHQCPRLVPRDPFQARPGRAPFFRDHLGALDFNQDPQVAQVIHQDSQAVWDFHQGLQVARDFRQDLQGVRDSLRVVQDFQGHLGVPILRIVLEVQVSQFNQSFKVVREITT